MDEFDLENSIVSIASISSEVAEGDSKMETSAESNKGNMYSAELCPTDTNLNDILPPSAMNEVSGVNSSETLLAEKRPGITFGWRIFLHEQNCIIRCDYFIFRCDLHNR